MDVQKLIGIFEQKSQNGEGDVQKLQRTQSMRTIRPKWYQNPAFKSADNEEIFKVEAKSPTEILQELQTTFYEVVKDVEDGKIALTIIQSRIIKLLFDLNLLEGSTLKHKRDELFKDIKLLYSDVLCKIQDEDACGEATKLCNLNVGKVLNRTVSTPVLHKQISVDSEPLEDDTEVDLCKVRTLKKKFESIEDLSANNKFNIAWTQDLGQMPRVKLQPFSMMPALTMTNLEDADHDDKIRSDVFKAEVGQVTRLRSMFEQRKPRDDKNVKREVKTKKKPEVNNNCNGIANRNAKNHHELTQSDKTVTIITHDTDTKILKVTKLSQETNSKNASPEIVCNGNDNFKIAEQERERRVSVSDLKKMFEVTNTTERQTLPRPKRSATFNVKSNVWKFDKNGSTTKSYEELHSTTKNDKNNDISNNIHSDISIDDASNSITITNNNTVCYTKPTFAAIDTSNSNNTSVVNGNLHSNGIDVECNSSDNLDHDTVVSDSINTEESFVISVRDLKKKFDYETDVVTVSNGVDGQTIPRHNEEKLNKVSNNKLEDLMKKFEGTTEEPTDVDGTSSNDNVVELSDDCNVSTLKRKFELNKKSQTTLQPLVMPSNQVTIEFDTSSDNDKSKNIGNIPPNSLKVIRNLSKVLSVSVDDFTEANFEKLATDEENALVENLEEEFDSLCEVELELDKEREQLENVEIIEKLKQ